MGAYGTVSVEVDFHFRMSRPATIEESDGLTLVSAARNPSAKGEFVLFEDPIACDSTTLLQYSDSHGEGQTFPTQQSLALPLHDTRILEYGKANPTGAMGGQAGYYITV